MGFDVTAAYIIFFVAVLAGGSAALGAYWTSADSIEGARLVQEDRADERAHTNMTITSASFNNGQSRFTVNVRNYGSTVIDISDLVFLVDGAYVPSATVESATVSGVASTDIWQPTETLEIRLKPITASPSNFKMVAGNGAAAYWGS